MEYALLHIVEDLTNKNLTADSLEKELYDVLHQRDELIHDSFDEALKTARVIDLEPVDGKKELLAVVSQTLDLSSTAPPIPSVSC